MHAPTPVDVCVDVPCSVVVYDCLDRLDVQAARSHVGRNQQVLLAGAEGFEDLHARELMSQDGT